MLKKRENAVIIRAKYMQRAGKVMQSFVENGCKSLRVVVAVVQQHYPNLDEKDIYNVWSYKTMNVPLIEKMENVLERLKQQ